MNNIGHIISGKTHYDSGKLIDIFNPSNGEVINSICSASNKIIEKTLSSSQKAFDEWKKYSIAK